MIIELSTMKRLDVEANNRKNTLPIGTVLQLNGYSNPKYAVIKNLGIDPKWASYGARYQCIAIDSYAEVIKQAYELEYIEDKTSNKIQTYITQSVISPEQCLELWEKAQAKKVSDQEKKEAEEKAKITGIENLKKENPHLIAGVGRVIGAKNIRIELKKAFPKIKFSVTSESFSGGNSIHVNWTDGPTRESVLKITDKYQHGYFDGMEDLYHYNAALWNSVFGGAKYVCESRSISTQRFNEVAKSLGYQCEFNRNTGSFDGVHYSTSEFIKREAYRTEFKKGK